MQSKSQNDTQNPKYGGSKILFMDLNNSLYIDSTTLPWEMNIFEALSEVPWEEKRDSDTP